LPKQKAKARFRFAPSPNGRLHLGHAYSALFAEQAARDAGGDLLLRIEDIDKTRTRPEFVDGILEDMDWLGIRFANDVRRQSNHFSDYRDALARLETLGLLYPCPATRKDIEADIATRPNSADWPRDPDGALLYPGIWRDRDPDEYEKLRGSSQPVAIRLHMTKALAELDRRGALPLSFCEDGSGPGGETGQVVLDPAIWGDVVLARKDTPTSYHLSVVVDDADQGISHVTRGEDLFYATIIHRLLQVLLDLPEPAYRHHRLIRAKDTRKLSKSAGDTSLESLRNSGVSASTIRRNLGLS
jgi:glutamyl-Q tRNA(Asp) synthetase